MAEKGHGALVARAIRRRQLLCAAVACVTAAWLGSCAELEQTLYPPQPEPQAVAPEPSAVAEPALPPAPKPRPSNHVARVPPPVEPPASPPQTAAAPAAHEPEPAPESESRPPAEIKLVGISRGEAAMLLGAPTEEKDVAPAKIWKFASGECALDIYFYLDVARNDFYALHYIVQDRYGVTTGEPADRCLQRIYSENRE